VETINVSMLKTTLNTRKSCLQYSSGHNLCVVLQESKRISVLFAPAQGNLCGVFVIAIGPLCYLKQCRISFVLFTAMEDNLCVVYSSGAG
jgi:hypothetical protein